MNRSILKPITTDATITPALATWKLRSKEQNFPYILPIVHLVYCDREEEYSTMNTTSDEFFKGADIIASYTWEQGIEDGALAKVFENRWPQLSGGKPIVATASIMEAFSLAALREIWNEYVEWCLHIMPTLKEEDRLFSTKMNNQTVWVMEDEAVFTILFPEDY
jgi:hypothetical protein